MGLNLLTSHPEVLTTCRFHLMLDVPGAVPLIDGKFTDCLGMKVSHKICEINEVTPKTWGKTNNARGRIVNTTIPGNRDSVKLTLKRGLIMSTTLWNWLETMSTTKSWGDNRLDGSIFMLGMALGPEAAFEFKNGWPVSYKVADLSNKNGQSQFEEIEISCEEFRRIPSSEMSSGSMGTKVALFAAGAAVSKAGRTALNALS